MGLNEPRVEMPPSPCVELGWRIMKNFWGFGYITDAATKALNYAFNTLHLNEVVAFSTIEIKNLLLSWCGLE